MPRIYDTVQVGWGEMLSDPCDVDGEVQQYAIIELHGEAYSEFRIEAGAVPRLIEGLMSVHAAILRSHLAREGQSPDALHGDSERRDAPDRE